MKRRDFIKVLGLSTVALTVQSRMRAGQPSNTKSNLGRRQASIIFVMADDLCHFLVCACGF